MLLQTARSIFARRGFEATTLRAIADESGTDPALVAHHFGSKAALWVAVVDQIASHIAALIANLFALRQQPNLFPGQRLEQALHALIRHGFTTPDIGMFFATAATEDAGRLQVLTDRLARPFQDAFVPLLEDAMRCGDIPQQDPHVLHSILTQGILHTISYSHMLRPFSSLPDQPEKFEAAVLKSVLLLVGLPADEAIKT